MINKQKVFIATGGKDFDANKPALVMLHGAGMDHTVWSMQARYFAHHGFSVINPDSVSYTHLTLPTNREV